MLIDALSVLCAQLTRDPLAIAKFLLHCRFKIMQNVFSSFSETAAGLCAFVAQVKLRSFQKSLVIDINQVTCVL